jgi:hypothetical protein
MKVRAALAVIAAGTVLLVGGAAQASEPTPTLTTKVYGDWTLTAPMVDQTDYTAQVLPPINSDGSSVWPAKRGVIPVQFKVTETKQSSAQFASLSAGLPYSVASWHAPAGLTVNQLSSLVANYGAYSQGGHGGGSLRWEIATPRGNVFVYFGDAPNFTSESADTGSGANLLARDDNRVDLSQVGGTFYDNRQHMARLVGDEPVLGVSLVVDSYWFQGADVLDLHSAQVTTSTGIASTFTMPEPTSSVRQTNEPPAFLKIERYNDGNYTEVANEALSSAQGDEGEQFRQVDGKYLYNLYNLKADKLGPGDFRVQIVIGGKSAAQATVAAFTLK